MLWYPAAEQIEALGAIEPEAQDCRGNRSVSPLMMQNGYWIITTLLMNSPLKAPCRIDGRHSGQSGPFHYDVIIRERYQTCHYDKTCWKIDVMQTEQTWNGSHTAHPDNLCSCWVSVEQPLGLWRYRAWVSRTLLPPCKPSTPVAGCRFNGFSSCWGKALRACGICSG